MSILGFFVTGPPSAVEAIEKFINGILPKHWPAGEVILWLDSTFKLGSAEIIAPALQEAAFVRDMETAWV